MDRLGRVELSSEREVESDEREGERERREGESE